MKDCRDMREKLWTSLGSGENGRDEAAMNEHLKNCPECRRTAEDVRKILDGAESVREELGDVMTGIDWAALPERIADAAFAGTKPAPVLSPARTFWKALFRPPYVPVFATLLVGVVLGAVATLLILNPPAGRRTAENKYSASSDLMDRAELQLAKRETLDYLDKSQYLILDFVQAGPGQSRVLAKDSAAPRLQDILSKKRYINQHLDTIQMAKAREICNQIEILLLELSQIDGELTAREEAEIKEFIEQRQILLKIKLLRKELQESEV